MGHGAHLRHVDVDNCYLHGINGSAGLLAAATAGEPQSARYSRVRQAQVALDQMEYTRDDLTRSLTSQAALAIDNINLNIKQVASSQLSVSQAERAHTIQQQSFEIGATTYLDLRDSELSLTRARLSYLQAIYNYLVADSNLELLLGNAPIDQYTNPEK